MPLTPADVANKHFRVVRQPFGGYNEDEVDTFLDEVEAEISRLLSENAALHSELEQARRARGEGAGPAQAAGQPAEATGEGGEQAALRTLLLAQRTADEAVAQARTEAEALLASAREEAAALQRQSRERYDAALRPLEERRRELERHLDSLVEFETDFRNRLRVYLQSRLAELDHPTVAVEALPTLPARPPGPDEPGLGEPAPGEPGLGEGSGEPEEWLDVPEAGPAPGPEPAGGDRDTSGPGGGEVDTSGPGGAHPVGGSPFAPGPPPAGR